MSTITITSSPYAMQTANQVREPLPVQPVAPVANGGEPQHSPLEHSAPSLSREARERLLDTVAEMREDGATVDEIRSFVSIQLQAYGVPESATGNLVDTYI